MVFDAEPRDVADSLPTETFQPAVEFTTSALQHSKPQLTWDEDDVNRTRLTKKRFNKAELNEMDYDA